MDDSDFNEPPIQSEEVEINFEQDNNYGKKQAYESLLPRRKQLVDARVIYLTGTQ
jgi:hypothetical protein